MKSKTITHIELHTENSVDIEHACQLLQAVLRNISMIHPAQRLYEELIKQGFFPVLDNSGETPFVWIIDPHLGMLKIHCPAEAEIVH